VTPYQQKVGAVVASSFTAAAISFLTAYLALVLSGHENAMGLKVAGIGALLAFVKDLHSFTSTAPKDVSDAPPASGS
jgi:hypothetical protein